jgi:Fatty acid hydroxylase superfamily
MYETLPARREALTARIEPGYSPVRHVTALVVVASGAVILAALGLHHVTPAEWAVVPFAFVLANFGEWAVHLRVLHEPRWPRIAYERHALTHHVLYTPASFAIRDARELRFVLMPWYGVVAMLGSVAPVAAGLAFAWSGNAARLFVLVSVGYYLVYEALHTLYHLPPGTPIARSRAVQALATRHRVHHEPRNMHKYNFNVTFPIADAVLGTWRRGP